ncbi:MULTISPECIES: hypothetical protein [Pseudomonas]|uniref:Uncharacterized protein n=2 Tax=Pseudomonas TaxID=286 RepID=A0AAP9VV55_9PSED|nr:MULTISPECIES: hypothetical protein [Pseudomonas]QNR48215.1 hypothetical protein HLB40_01575 [Pseudomonas chlororaphis]
MNHLLGSSKGPMVASADDRKGQGRTRLGRVPTGMTLYPIKIDFRSHKNINSKIKPDKYRFLSVFIGSFWGWGCLFWRYREQARSYRNAANL